MLREERQAALVRKLVARGKRIAEARDIERNEMRLAKPEALAAMEAGVTTRRVRDLLHVSLDTLNRWKQQASDEGS